MLRSEQVFSLIKEEGIQFFAGVPDSLLKDFCAYVTDHTDEKDHVIAANEGSAVALAAGHFIATGRPALVYMQNSGIGNAVNPLMSLADPEVYSIPMLLMIGWRGEPGVKDEPQHVKQGRIMPALLDALEIPWYCLDANTEDPAGLIADAAATMRQRMGPVAILVRKGTFESYKLQKTVTSAFPLSREEAISCIIDVLRDTDIVIATTGMASRELYECRVRRGDTHSKDFLTVGSMGHAASIAHGSAGSLPGRRVICLDGDGSVLMHMGTLAVIGQSELKNFVHIVINNGAHDSVGGQPTVAFGIDLPAIATACGYREAHTAKTTSEIRAFLQSSSENGGPVLLEVRVNKGARADLGRPKTSPMENRDALMKQLGVYVGPEEK